MGELMLSSVGGMSLCKANIAKTRPEHPHLPCATQALFRRECVLIHSAPHSFF